MSFELFSARAATTVMRVTQRMGLGLDDGDYHAQTFAWEPGCGLALDDLLHTETNDAGFVAFALMARKGFARRGDAFAVVRSAAEKIRNRPADDSGAGAFLLRGPDDALWVDHLVRGDDGDASFCGSVPVTIAGLLDAFGSAADDAVSVMLRRFLDNDVPWEEFEVWVFGSLELEQALKAEDHQELVDLVTFPDNHLARKDLKRLVSRLLQR